MKLESGCDQLVSLKSLKHFSFARCSFYAVSLVWAQGLNTISIWRWEFKVSGPKRVIGVDAQRRVRLAASDEKRGFDTISL